MDLRLAFAFSCIVSVALSFHLDHPLSDRFIEQTNLISKTWKAGRNFPEGTSLNALKRRLGVLPSFEDQLVGGFQHDIPEDFEFPEEFDARVQWSYCPSIHEIRDQASCGSCWAISGAEVMTDRSCIHSGGKMNFHYSTEDIVSCCTYCGHGCNGGYPDKAFEFWIDEGVVSGGPYNSSLGCYPYEVPNDRHFSGTPSCKTDCQEDYEKSYSRDKHFGKDLVRISKNEKNIMYEIITNGPVVADFNVFEDFYNYKSGVYQHIEGRYAGGHAIRILGYGVEDGTPYWLCANSWNYNWGDQGYFKILRGENECGIERHIVAALPDYDSY